MRLSHHISRKAVTTLLHSARTAAAVGRPFNIAICIDTWALGIVAEAADSSFRRMRRQRFARWSTYRPRATGIARNGPPVDTWVWEAPCGRHHVHWLLHVAPARQAEFRSKLLKWVAAMAGLSAGAALPHDAVHIADVINAEGMKLYLAKGVDPHYARLWNIRPVNCGMVIGRRAGSARAVGPSVWKPLKRAYLNGRV